MVGEVPSREDPIAEEVRLMAAPGIVLREGRVFMTCRCHSMEVTGHFFQLNIRIRRRNPFEIM